MGSTNKKRKKKATKMKKKVKKTKMKKKRKKRSGNNEEDSKQIFFLFCVCKCGKTPRFFLTFHCPNCELNSSRNKRKKPKRKKHLHNAEVPSSRLKFCLCKCRRCSKFSESHRPCHPISQCSCAKSKKKKLYFSLSIKDFSFEATPKMDKHKKAKPV